jgi:hypothetical protein
VAQHLTHDPRERIALRQRDVGERKRFRVELVARAEGGDDGNAPRERRLDQIELAGDKIDGVDNGIVTFGEKPLPGRTLRSGRRSP